MKNQFRTNQIYISPEVSFYLKLVSKMGAKDQTADEIADSTLRVTILFQHPEWQDLWDEYQRAKQESIRRYNEIESRACQHDSEPTTEE